METSSRPPDQHRIDGPQLERMAREIVDAHAHFYRRGDQFEFSYREGVLTIRGTTRSFYLKQLLQTALQDMVKGTCQIENYVIVAAFSRPKDNAGRVDPPRSGVY